MAAEWQKFKQNLKEKRTGPKKNQTGKNRKPSEDFIIVQRLSQDVSGKAQKYRRIGAREFVPFDNENEKTIETIREACSRHFGTSSGLICDVLAGEQGPSCSSLKQLPDMKVIHVRFMDSTSNTTTNTCTRPCLNSTTSKYPYQDNSELIFSNMPKKIRKVVSFCDDSNTNSFHRVHTDSTTTTSRPTPTFIPKSLSVIDMIKLGKVVQKSDTCTTIQLWRFNINSMTWIQYPQTTNFVTDSKLLGEGGFRRAYIARPTPASSSLIGPSDTKTWVLKEYLENSVDIITQTNQTIEQHTKKIVQMHNLAKNFAEKLLLLLRSNGNLLRYGEVMVYNNILMGKKMESGEYVTYDLL
ncbi:hypothetical protein SNE40_009959 [Patella caerulea]|uniref:Uncharacterized protein n=1 Tax=Patella caerulea TaxID=87958 RepID=A0AAN8PZA8_PATCE